MIAQSVIYFRNVGVNVTAPKNTPPPPPSPSSSSDSSSTQSDKSSSPPPCDATTIILRYYTDQNPGLVLSCRCLKISMAGCPGFFIRLCAGLSYSEPFGVLYSIHHHIFFNTQKGIGISMLYFSSFAFFLLLCGASRDPNRGKIIYNFLG